MELKPCPFCGGEASHPHGDKSIAGCYNTGCWISCSGTTPEVWNNRAKSLPRSIVDLSDTITLNDGMDD